MQPPSALARGEEQEFWAGARGGQAEGGHGSDARPSQLSSLVQARARALMQLPSQGLKAPSSCSKPFLINFALLLDILSEVHLVRPDLEQKIADPEVVMEEFVDLALRSLTAASYSFFGV